MIPTGQKPCKSPSIGRENSSSYASDPYRMSSEFCRSSGSAFGCLPSVCIELVHGSGPALLHRCVPGIEGLALRLPRCEGRPLHGNCRPAFVRSERNRRKSLQRPIRREGVPSHAALFGEHLGVRHGYVDNQPPGGRISRESGIDNSTTIHPLALSCPVAHSPNEAPNDPSESTPSKEQNARPQVPRRLPCPQPYGLAPGAEFSAARPGA
jgi:hypothetical protein